MAFFGKSLSSRKIDINLDSLSADDPEVLKRLDRIEDNFSKLDDILSRLEARFDLDDRLSSENVDETMVSRNVRKKPR